MAGYLHWRDSLTSSTELELTGKLPDSRKLIQELENSEKFKERKRHRSPDDEITVTMEAVPVVDEGDGKPLRDENNNPAPASVHTVEPTLPDFGHQPLSPAPQEMPPPPPPPPDSQQSQSSKSMNQPASSPPLRYGANATEDHAHSMKSLNEDFAKFDKSTLRKTETNSEEQIQQRRGAMDKTLDKIRSFDKSSMTTVETNSPEHIAEREKTASKTPRGELLESIKSFKPDTMLNKTSKKDKDQ